MMQTANLWDGDDLAQPRRFHLAPRRRVAIERQMRARAVIVLEVRSQNPHKADGVFGRGGNFYAAQTWTNPPDGRRVQISWMAGGRYPGMPFNQQQSFPCELKLVTTAAGPRLTRWPVKEIEKLYQGEPKTLADLTLKADGENPLSGVSGELFDIELTFKPGKTSVFNLNMHNQSVTWTAGQLTVFGRKAALPVADDGTVSLHILLDRTSIETFGNKGLLSMTSCILPKDLKTDLAVSVTGDNVLMKSIVVRKLRSAWEY